MEPWTTFAGLAGAIGTTVAWLPQVAATLRSRSARDISWGYLRLFSFGVAMWLVYGILRRDPVIVLANVTTLLLVLTVASVKWRERSGAALSGTEAGRDRA